MYTTFDTIFFMPFHMSRYKGWTLQVLTLKTMKWMLRLAVGELQPVEEKFVELTLVPCERAWNTMPENGVRSFALFVWAHFCHGKRCEYSREEILSGPKSQLTHQLTLKIVGRKFVFLSWRTNCFYRSIWFITTVLDAASQLSNPW